MHITCTLVIECAIYWSLVALHISGNNWKKWPKVTKNSVYFTLYLRNHISWLWFMVLMCEMISDFPGGFFWGEGRCKIAKNDPLLPISVCHTLYLRNCISFLVRRWKIMISPGVYLYFKKIIQHCKYQNLCIFYWSTSGCFSSWSVNSKQEFWGVFHLLHICVIFCIYLFL